MTFFFSFPAGTVRWLVSHENIVSVTSSLQMKRNFINDSSLAAFLLCFTSKWILGAVCRCHNNKVPAGQFVCKWHWAWPDIPASTTGPGCHGNAQLFLKSFLLLSSPPFLFLFFFYFVGGKDTAAFLWHCCTASSPQVLRKEEEVWVRRYNWISWIGVKWWLVLCCRTRRTADGRRGSGGRRRGVLDRVSWQPLTGTPPLSPISWAMDAYFSAETENSKCPAGSRPPLHELKVTTRIGL